MELKVICDCGQKFAFDVEPINGRMPTMVNCPSCGLDGTQSANDVLSRTFSSQPAAIITTPVTIAPAALGLRVNRQVSQPVTTDASSSLTETSPPIAPLRSISVTTVPKPKKMNEFNLGLGILGAVLGAGLGGGLMYGLYAMEDFRFPLMGTGIGALTGLGARILYKGTDTTLGIISGAIALLATAGTLYLMYGQVAAMFIISMIVSVSFAYKIAG
jgi:hypothetical protein